MLGPLGLGLAPLGNLYSEVSDADVPATLAAARQQGIQWFDVAPLYGYGLAEVRLGRYLKDSPAPLPCVSTKVGRVLEPATTTPAHAHFVSPLKFQPAFDYSAAGIERSYIESLRRLGLERVPVLLLHDVDRTTHAARHRSVIKQVLEESLPTLNRLKSEGRIDAMGLGVNEWDVGYEILASADLDCVLIAGRYTLLDASGFTSGFLDACARRGVAVLAGGVFNSGFLAGGSHYAYREAIGPVLAARQRLTSICDRYGVALPAAALQFTAAHPAITSVVVGARSAAEVEAILSWSRERVPPGLWSELRGAGLIPEDAPTPATAD
jgi:D-threo-aldose 1-dehydrogenase